MPSTTLVSLAALAIALLTASPALAATSIRLEPGGERVLFVDGPDIRPAPGGERLLFVDEGRDIRREPGSPSLLFVDGDSIRPGPGGTCLLFFDGDDIRREPGGPRLLVLDGKDIRPEPGGERLLYVDGPDLSRAQLAAVLFQRMPALFKPAPGPGDAPSVTSRDRIEGTYSIAAFSSSDGSSRKGKVAIARTDERYALRLDLGGGVEWQGAGVRAPGGELWAAIGPNGSTGIVLYEIEGGKLLGRWGIASAVGHGAAWIGTENLEGSASLEGAYRITGATNPGGATAYGGSAVLASATAPVGDAPAITVEWRTSPGIPDAVTARGAGFRVKDRLVVAFGDTGDTAIVRFKVEAGSLAGDLMTIGGATGSMKLVRE